jgi:hypothetical protein
MKCSAGAYRVRDPFLHYFGSAQTLTRSVVAFHFATHQEPSKRIFRSATRCVQGSRVSLNCQSRISR